MVLTFWPRINKCILPHICCLMPLRAETYEHIDNAHRSQPKLTDAHDRPCHTC